MKGEDVQRRLNEARQLAGTGQYGPMHVVIGVPSKLKRSGTQEYRQRSHDPWTMPMRENI